jgi:hypothetical protein
MTTQPIDVLPAIAALQDQIDDLIATVAAQQATIEALTVKVDRGRR